MFTMYIHSANYTINNNYTTIQEINNSYECAKTEPPY